MSTNDDTQDEGGLEPAADTSADVAVTDDQAPPEAPPEETYTRSQLAEMLPHFDRFATHEGPEAFKQYGAAYDSARRLISTGGHTSTQEEDAYRGAGIDPSEVQIPQQADEPAPGLFGTPWELPTTWQEVQDYANTDDPNLRKLAAMAVLAEPRADELTKNAYFNHWASIDPAGAALYQQQVMSAQQQQLADQIREELRAEMQAQFGPARERHVNDSVDAMLARATADIPGFAEHKEGIVLLMQEREQRYPGYKERFDAATLDERVAELDELTTIAAKRFAPQRKAAQAAATSETDAAKQRARTETGRTSGAPETDADARRRAERAVMKRIGPTIHL